MAKKKTEEKPKSKGSKPKKDTVKVAESVPVKVRAELKDALQSPQKIRLVARLIAGKSVPEAMDILDLTNKKAAQILKKVLKSAVANAENNENLDPESLYLSEVQINEGSKLKRFRFVSRGGVHGYVKRRSHVLIELSEKE